jgi:hypothetical protein
VDLAEIRARYVGSKMAAQVAADLDALWHEVDRLRFALAGSEGRATRIFEEKEAVERRMYLVLSKVPGAGMPV